jgi:hypothetical protein
MGTAVSLVRGAQDSGVGQWTLEEDEAYLIGHPGHELYVQVERRTGPDPHLVLSNSTIRPDILWRFITKRKLRRLREKNLLDMHAKDVVVCAVKK